MLYWAEGSRHRNQIRFTNSDPEMVRFFVTFLRMYFFLRDEDIRVSCNLFPDHVERQLEIEQFWLEVVGVAASSLRKSTVNTYSKYSQNKRQNKLPYGTARGSSRASTGRSRNTPVSSARPGWNRSVWRKRAGRIAITES
jgi:hypothetical protein